MKVLKILGLTIGGLLLVLVLVGFLLPGQVNVSRSLTINAPPSVVFNHLNTLTDWEAWSPWHKLDPNMKLTYEGAPAGVGAKYNWESQQRNVGNGSLTITESVQDQRVRTALDFREQGQATAAFDLAKEGEGTKVTWSMHTEFGKNPIARYFGLLMDSMIGPDFERGLQNLKAVSESKGKS